MLLLKAKKSIQLCLQDHDLLFDEDLRVCALLVQLADLSLVGVLLVDQELVSLVQFGLPAVQLLAKFALDFVGLCNLRDLLRQLVFHGRFGAGPLLV